MALKKTLNKEQYDALPADFQKEYKASGENFVLDVEGDQEEHWRNKHRIAEEHRKNAEQARDAANNELDQMRRGAIPKNDVEALENSWKAKLDTANQNHAKELADRDAVIANTTVTNVASELATMFLAPALAIPMIRSRLKSEIVNGTAVTRVLDKNGQPSALSLEDLKNEFKADATLASVLVGGKGTGGGGGEGGDKGAGGDKKLKDMNDKERVEFARRDPEGFKRAVATQNK